MEKKKNTVFFYPAGAEVFVCCNLTWHHIVKNCIMDVHAPLSPTALHLHLCHHFDMTYAWCSAIINGGILCKIYFFISLVHHICISVLYFHPSRPRAAASRCCYFTLILRYIASLSKRTSEQSGYIPFIIVTFLLQAAKAPLSTPNTSRPTERVSVGRA